MLKQVIVHEPPYWAAIRAVTAESDLRIIASLGQHSQEDTNGLPSLKKKLRHERSLLQQANQSNTEDDSSCFAFLRRRDSHAASLEAANGEQPLQPRLSQKFLAAMASRLDGLMVGIEKQLEQSEAATSSTDRGAPGPGVAVSPQPPVERSAESEELWARVKSAEAAKAQLEERARTLEGAVNAAEGHASEWQTKHAQLLMKLAQMEELLASRNRSCEETQTMVAQAAAKAAAAEQERATAVEYARETQQALDRTRTALMSSHAELQEQVKEAEQRAVVALRAREDMVRDLDHLRQEKDALQAELCATVQRIEEERNDIQAQLAQVSAQVVTDSEPARQQDSEVNAEPLRSELKDAEHTAAAANKALATTMAEYEQFRKQISKKALALTDELHDVRMKLKHFEDLASTSQSGMQASLEQHAQLEQAKEENGELRSEMHAALFKLQEQGELRSEMQSALYKLNEQVRLSEAERGAAQLGGDASSNREASLEHAWRDNELLRNEMAAAQAKLEAQRRASDEDRATWWNELNSIRQQDAQPARQREGSSGPNGGITRTTRALRSPGVRKLSTGTVVKRPQSPSSSLLDISGVWQPTGSPMAPPPTAAIQAQGAVQRCSTAHYAAAPSSSPFTPSPYPSGLQPGQRVQRAMVAATPPPAVQRCGTVERTSACASPPYPLKTSPQLGGAASPPVAALLVGPAAHG